MKLFILLIFVLLTVYCSSAKKYVSETTDLKVPKELDYKNFQKQNNITTSSRGSRISNGYYANSFQFPYVVELTIYSTTWQVFVCTASLIHYQWLLGARRCVKGDFEAMFVWSAIGSADRYSYRAHIYSHRNIILNSMDGSPDPDIALFQLYSYVYYNYYAYPVQLPSSSQAGMDYEGQIITVAGWGKINSFYYSRYLQWTQFTVLPSSECECTTCLCSRTPATASTLEAGDSGGPSLILENGVPTIIGINKLTRRDVSPIIQEATKVNLFLDFINEHTGIPIRQ